MQIAPWLVMGLGVWVGGVPTLWHFFNPRRGNPWVLAWWGVVIGINLLLFLWIFFRDGAEYMEAHPAFQPRRSGLSIKLQAALYLQTGGAHLIDNVQVGGGNLNNGIEILTDSNTIQYSSIVGNSGDGIYISGGNENLIRNSWIGVTASGIVSRNRSSGVALNNADNNDIGGLAGYRNMIVGNDNGGIDLGGGSAGTVLQSNYIGLKEDGATPLGNNGIGGVKIGFASGTTLGGAIVESGRFDWGGLDYLIVDFPPGTGDEQISTAQLLGEPRGAVIVSTPQQVSILDSVRTIDFCRKLKIPMLR